MEVLKEAKSRILSVFLRGSVIKSKYFEAFFEITTNFSRLKLLIFKIEVDAFSIA